MGGDPEAEITGRHPVFRAAANGSGKAATCTTGGAEASESTGYVPGPRRSVPRLGLVANLLRIGRASLGTDFRRSDLKTADTHLVLGPAFEAYGDRTGHVLPCFTR